MTPIELAIIFLLIALCCFLLRGVVNTFRRNFLLALIMMILLGPLWLIWVIIEMFRTDLS